MTEEESRRDAREKESEKGRCALTESIHLTLASHQRNLEITIRFLSIGGMEAK